VDVCSRPHSASPSALRATSTESAGFSTPPLSRVCDRRCPGQTDRGSPAPLTSDREGATPDWSKADTAPDFAATRLEPPSKEATPPEATQRGQLRSPSEQRRGARSIRGRARGSYSIATVEGPSHPSTTGSSAPRNHRLWRDDGERWLGASTAERLVLLRLARDERGQKQVHAPLHGRKRRGSGCAARKGPRSRALTGSGRACSPGDQGHAWAAGSRGCVVKRSLDQQTMLVFERSAGCSCTWVSCRC